MQEATTEAETTAAEIGLADPIGAAGEMGPSVVLLALSLVVYALALQLMLSSARRAARTTRWPDRLADLLPGVLGMGLGLWASGVLGVIGLERGVPLAFDPYVAATLLPVALLAAVPPLLLLSSRGSDVARVGLLMGTAALLIAGSVLLSLGWVFAARLDPPPQLELRWLGLDLVLVAAGLAAALALARKLAREGRLLRRLRYAAAALGGGIALTLAQVLVHESVQIADETVSGAAATLQVALLSGLGGVVPMVLLGMLLLRRLPREARDGHAPGADGGAGPRRSARRQGRLL